MRGFTTELGVGQWVINRTEQAKVFQEANIKVLQRQNIGFIKLLLTYILPTVSYSRLRT